MINIRIYMKFKPYDDDQGLHLLNKKESRVDSQVEKDGSIMQERCKKNMIELLVFLYLVDVLL